MRKFFYILCLMFYFLVNQQSLAKGSYDIQETTKNDTAEKYLIGLIIDDINSCEDNRKGFWVISDSTKASYFGVNEETKLCEKINCTHFSELSRNFKFANSITLRYKYDSIVFNDTLLSQSMLDTLFSELKNKTDTNWRILRKKIHGFKGVMEFSNIVYTDDKNIAVIYVGFYCGNLCGSGNYYYFIKQEGQWNLAYIQLSWVM